MMKGKTYVSAFASDEKGVISAHSPSEFYIENEKIRNIQDDGTVILLKENQVLEYKNMFFVDIQRADENPRRAKKA